MVLTECDRTNACQHLYNRLLPPAPHPGTETRRKHGRPRRRLDPNCLQDAMRRATTPAGSRMDTNPTRRHQLLPAPNIRSDQNRLPLHTPRDPHPRRTQHDQPPTILQPAGSPTLLPSRPQPPTLGNHRLHHHRLHPNSGEQHLTQTAKPRHWGSLPTIARLEKRLRHQRLAARMGTELVGVW